MKSFVTRMQQLALAGFVAFMGLSCTTSTENDPLYETPTLTTLSSGVTDRLTRVQFLNENVGYISGQVGVILKTKDAGKTWVKQTTGITTALNSLNFVDENTGWAVGAASTVGTTTVSTILNTSDGGTTWTRQTVGGTARALNSVKFIDKNTGWAVGANGTIYHTTNGGTTWAIQANIDTLGMRGSWVRKRIAAGENTTSTTNGTIGGTTLNYIHAIDAKNLYILGNAGYIFKSTDGGNKWKWMETESLNAVYGISYPTNNTAFICGANGMILKMNANGTFEDRTNKANTRSFRDLYFINENYGWAIGEHGYIYKTTNGGKYWGQEVDPSQVYIFYSCFFIKPDLGYFVGNNGTIVKVQDIKLTN
ncbi:YCF48-related protein [Arcicella sp. LKC2W]|uniref:WD40/YVTN/BNR-like repeat-containing protein n=1 Tax=Arcicella sp. LKC2W TaxID=2984198 RepID=UPI002B1F3C66|nr:YCF48-related protein [Arcicella sp. LKC2W]MEA5461864.1 YCF48-related protein [Arcicella sp. LKC2W]